MLKKDVLRVVPKQPGCYRYYDINNSIIYVGKAKNLYNRVNSYFVGKKDPKTTALINSIEKVEWTITNSEKEALLLEISLIHEYMPKYNIDLKDQKTYPYIKITNDDYPRVVYTRQLKNDGGKYFGPYPNPGAARDTARLVDSIFDIRKCSTIPKKECLYAHIDQCCAPCINNISYSVYDDKVSLVEEFLKGNDKTIVRDLEAKMLNYSENLEFEKAGETKELIESIEVTTEKQVVNLDYATNKDIDVVGTFSKSGYTAIYKFFIRNNVIVSTDGILHKDSENIEYGNHILENYILPTALICDQVLVDDFGIPETNIIKIPKIGDKRQLVKLANDNAEEYLNKHIKGILEKIESNSKLEKLIGLSKIRTIEVFDISHTNGANNVAGMISIKNAEFDKNNYRKFKLEKDNNNEYDSMREATFRRYSRTKKEKREMPNLILLDGGQLQINVVNEVLNDLNINIPIAGLVKNESHQLRGLIYKGTEYKLEDRELKKYLYLISEEVHRWAISFHKQKRNDKMLKSFLDDINGLGEKRKQLLREYYPNIDDLYYTDLDSLVNIGLPKKVAMDVMTQIIKVKQ